MSQVNSQPKRDLLISLVSLVLEDTQSFRELEFEMRKLILTSAVALALGACSAKIESNYPVPEIPKASTVTSELHGVGLSFQSFVDARMPLRNEVANKSSIHTQPEGDVAGSVEQAFKEALTVQGANVGYGTGKMVTGEIRRWDSQVAAAASGSIESNATLFIEVKGETGERLFAGEYHGSRSSTFPVIARQDVGESLGIAMSEAITQALRDPNLRRVLR